QGGNMNKLYFLLFFIVVVCGAYIVGGRVASEKCRGAVANDIVAHQMKFIRLQEDINAEAVSRGGDDIRRVLREKYTIAE
ncbi:MAG: hypothetical protein IJE82_01130, partial [Alphaproteobacteria bacterium]|nr:hypothetical protein [Alphaproteobacteria bacterium]